jgi:ferric-dicitrate binding protein FerR (iron transport regulator)
MPPETRLELLRLLSAQSDGELGDEQHARLDLLLAADADNRRLYMEYTDLHARLLTHPSLGTSDLSVPEQFAASYSPLTTRHSALSKSRQYLRYALVAAATLVASLLVQALIWPRPARENVGPPAIAAQRAKPQFIATLTRTADCVWESGGGPGPVGSRLLPEDLYLRKGVARVNFDGGPELTIEGPATVRLESPTAATVLRGKVVFKADDAGGPFDLHTPASTLVDFGTEYAVSVTADGEEVHVFEGEVQRTSPAAGAERLTAGEARRYGPSPKSVGEPTALDAERFVRRLAVPVQPAEGLLAYDGFDYGDANALEAGRANGGSGWAGSWTPGFARPLNPGDENRLALRVGRSLTRPGSTSVGGSFDYAGFAKYFRRLATPIRMDADGIFYLSFLIRREGPPADALNSVSVQLRTTAEMETEWGRGEPDLRMRLNFGVDRANDVFTHLERVGARSPLPLSYGETYLVVAKIAASAAHPDQTFVRVYGPEEPVGREEPGQWSLVGRPIPSDLVFDWFEVHINSKTRQTIDEVRIGTTWAAVTAPWSGK